MFFFPLNFPLLNVAVPSVGLAKYFLLRPHPFLTLDDTAVEF